jgi:CRP/FNR family transcriptional regulator, cyclic AMP receptor protein
MYASSIRPIEAVTLLGKTQQKRQAIYKAGTVIFRESDLADSVYFIETGRVQVSRVSPTGREGIVALLTDGDFVGETCLLGETRRMDSAVCVSGSRLWRIEKQYLIALLRSDPQFAEMFLGYLLGRNARYEDDLADQLFNSTEKRLARALLLMAHFRSRCEPVKTIPALSHATLAQIVGTTRPRVTHFMSKFKQLGYIEYDRNTLLVHSSLMKVLLQE